MGLFKSPEEKSAKQERRAQEAHARSPVGRAAAAQERGDALFQVAVPVDEGSAQVLSQIEATGWRLEHAGYTFIVSGGSTTNWDGGSSVVMGGELMGIYLFRRPQVPERQGAGSSAATRSASASSTTPTTDLHRALALSTAKHSAHDRGGIGRAPLPG